MRIVDTKLLKRMAEPGNCEVCRKYCKRREAHHIRSRGSGGSDIAINLISLGSTISCYLVFSDMSWLYKICGPELKVVTFQTGPTQRLSRRHHVRPI